MFLFAACLILFGGCSDGSILAAEEKAAIVAELETLHESMRTALIEGNATVLGQIHSANGTITYDRSRFSGEAFLGWAERTGTGGRKQQVGPFENLQIDVLSGNAAASVFDFRYAFLDSLGVPGTAMRANKTLTWAKEDGHWKVLHLHESTWEEETTE